MNMRRRVPVTLAIQAGTIWINNNNGYLEHLTRAGPKRLHIL